MDFYTYFRSSAAYRVRIALNLKGLSPTLHPVHLLNHGGEQHSEFYRRLNPAELVPVLVDHDQVIPQSLAICEYLDEIHPLPRLLPGSPAERARIRSLALAVACDIHPLSSLRVFQYLTGPLGLSEDQKLGWHRHWVSSGLEALETTLNSSSQTGKFCHGNSPTLADLCLIPQMYNARRFGMDTLNYPTLTRIEAACLDLPAFLDAAPDKQADAGQVQP